MDGASAKIILDHVGEQRKGRDDSDGNAHSHQPDKLQTGRPSMSHKLALKSAKTVVFLNLSLFVLVGERE